MTYRATGAFDLQVQVGSAGTAGPAAAVHKTVGPAAIELIGVVYARWIGTPGPLSAPSPDPVAGAVVSTSLNSKTVTTGANGSFDLQTGATATSCYTLTISAPGLPSYVVQRKSGSTDLVAYTLGSSPQYPIPNPCS